MPVVDVFSVFNDVHGSECKDLSIGTEQTACQNRAKERSGIFQHFSGSILHSGVYYLVAWLKILIENRRYSRTYCHEHRQAYL